ncbi:MAG: class I SAM-dependent methyltransferase [Candidatus Kariarchaeaceae archaeon]|jgi:SAM-dependent methyltransferase
MVKKDYSDEIKLVRKGYEKAAKPYRQGKDNSQHEIPIFQEWLNKPANTKILELGCASGFPIGKAIIESGKDYIGIDLSETQIQLARSEFPKWKEHFQVAEMLDFCQNAPSSTYTGIVSMFSIRHLPRIHHAELFTELYRILQPKGLLLIDCTRNIDRGSTEEWLGGSQMYWSGFSKDWTMMTLAEIGLKFVNSYEDKKMFHGELETTLFLLYKKE